MSNNESKDQKDNKENQESSFKWTPCKIIIIILFFIYLVPLCIDWLYTIPAICSFFATSWGATEALGYYGDVLSFIGTVSLGAFTLHQNQQIKDEADKREKLLFEMEKLRNAPIFMISPCGREGRNQKLKFNIINVTQNIIREIEITNACIITTDNKKAWDSVNKKSFAFIGSQDSRMFELTNPSFEDGELQFEIICKDIYGDNHNFKAYFGSNEKVSSSNFLSIEKI